MKPIDLAIMVLKEDMVAQQHDLPTYMREAMKQVGDARKKRSEAQKLRDQITDHEEDGKIYQYYRENHPDWFSNFMGGNGQ
tara:strand:- start:253 stop:495 length:243 start_codon:yes stop_codon:yes gene_type:complete